MDFDQSQYKAWKLPNLLLLHWVINPGLAFNEIILGQRIPKLTLIDKISDAPLMERQYVPCPHCATIHKGTLWAKKAAFGNWFGYLCPTCDKTIPCLWNITSLILLTLTFPVWGWFRSSLETKWRSAKKRQYANSSDDEPVTAKNTAWLKMGLLYGVIMFCGMSLPQILKSEVSLVYIATQIGIWLIAGLVFGGAMKLFLGRKNKNIKNSERN
ncbi:hypothetical protein [Thalassotalea profundi]|uniref:MFS transporter n=1 Tax=Thalassotalea profundi TaxID=2036687 RepID=A0ABQ3IPL7_9GAMM|nr:hypothetical protein [Thalassotalea profundi]GHE88845.1 hypothetical protein GCM10011501_17850 [Thalassotalea profundi]